MMRSLYSGVSGLKNHQTRMDVVGNNISNVNTTGFKSSRVTFSDTLSQTLSGASAPTENRGGTNPKQIGLGSATSSIDMVCTVHWCKYGFVFIWQWPLYCEGRQSKLLYPQW